MKHRNTFPKRVKSLAYIPSDRVVQIPDPSVFLRTIVPKRIAQPVGRSSSIVIEFKTSTVPLRLQGRFGAGAKPFTGSFGSRAIVVTAD
jgi:hypothetical protein